MVDVFSLAIAVLLVAGVVYLALAVMMPTIYLYTRSYKAAANWLRRYFRHDIALYSPFDLVYLYLTLGRSSEVPAMYRKLQRKGNIGSEYFVDAWVAAHEGDWRAAEAALDKLKKYSITNDVNADKLTEAVAHKSATEVDEIYLIDMNGRAVVEPSFFRVAWVVLAGGLAMGLIWAALVYFVLLDVDFAKFTS